MDSDEKRIATGIVHVASLFGFATNVIAMLTIAKSIKLRTSFGILCACLAANNTIVLVLNSAWYLMPARGIFAIGSALSRTVGMIGLALFVAGIRFHILISFNRLIALIFPLTSQHYVTKRSTTAAVVVALVSSFLQCAPLVSVKNLWFCYDPRSMKWVFSPNEIGRFYEFYFNYLPISVEFSVVLLLDILTIAYLRLHHLNTVQSDISPLSNKASEIRLFKQAFSQSIPLLTTFTCFAFVTPHLSKNFDKFLSTTLMWHLAHAIDGLIIDLFHTRLSLFMKSEEIPSTFMGSSSIAPNAAF